ncbi:MAG: hypothetical protein WC478_03940 [Candidatus Omnitrophota bacterium]
MVEKPQITRIFLISFLALLPCSSLNAGPVDSGKGWKVNSGATEDVDTPDGCNKVTNNSPTGLAIYIPLGTSVEWGAFKNNLPPGVSISSCCVPVGCAGRCGVVDNGCGTMIDCGLCPTVCRAWHEREHCDGSRVAGGFANNISQDDCKTMCQNLRGRCVDWTSPTSPIARALEVEGAGRCECVGNQDFDPTADGRFAALCD